MKEHTVQVGKEHYGFRRYCYPDRWASYYHQLEEIVATKPTSVLEIGAGDETVKRYMQKLGVGKYVTMDIADDLAPDIKGSITAIPLEDKSFDTVCAFEVLEHIPFEEVSQALSELARVAKKYVLVSVPHFGPPVRVQIKIPFLPQLTLFKKIPFPKTHVFNGQHYWELGKKGYPVRRLRELMRDTFSIEKEFVPDDNAYHHFFVLRPLV